MNDMSYANWSNKTGETGKEKKPVIKRKAIYQKLIGDGNIAYSIVYI